MRLSPYQRASKVVAEHVAEQSVPPRQCGWTRVAIAVYTQQLGVASVVAGLICFWLGIDLFLDGASSVLGAVVGAVVLVGGLWFILAPAVIARRLTWMIRHGEIAAAEVQSASQSARSVDADVLVRHPRGSFHDLVHERGSWAPKLSAGSKLRALVHPERNKVLLYLD
jgi:hypothetical protein